MHVATYIFLAHTTGRAVGGSPVHQLLLKSAAPRFLSAQGQTRLARYYEERKDLSAAERTAQEADIVRKCLMRGEQQCSFLEYKGYKIAYRRCRPHSARRAHVCSALTRGALEDTRRSFSLWGATRTRTSWRRSSSSTRSLRRSTGARRSRGGSGMGARGEGAGHGTRKYAAHF